MNEREMQSLLALAAKRLHTTPEALRAAAENGDLQNITGSQNNAAASQLNRVLSDPEAAKKLLSTPAAQKLFEALGGKNRKEVSGGGRPGRSRTIHFKRPAKHGAAAGRDELAWHESAASLCPGFAAGAAKPAAAAPLNLLNTLNNSDPMTAMLLRAAPLLASANREDDSTRLLAALRPLLGEARQKKLDEASKILKLLHLLPLLKESGVLQNIL